MSEETARYAGAGWLRDNLKYANPTMQVSEFGARVADLLGFLYMGLYHLDGVEKHDWSQDYRIAVTIGKYDLSTYDNDRLTVLVLLAHRMAIRVAIESASPWRLRLIFSNRRREGKWHERHPDITEALVHFEQECYLEEDPLPQTRSRAMQALINELENGDCEQCPAQEECAFGMDDSCACSDAAAILQRSLPLEAKKGPVD